jgi:hypothetical protein
VRIGVGKIIVASGESERIVVSRESDSGPLPRSSVSCVIRSEPQYRGTSVGGNPLVYARTGMDVKISGWILRTYANFPIRDGNGLSILFYGLVSIFDNLIPSTALQGRSACDVRQVRPTCQYRSYPAARKDD